jgi:hypothetical protein
MIADVAATPDLIEFYCDLSINDPSNPKPEASAAKLKSAATYF